MAKREAVYKRELNHSYMVLGCSGEELAERYDYRIMMNNRIGRLLPCSLRQMDGEDFLYYDISSRQPLERLYEGGKLRVQDLAEIIRKIAAVQADLGEYMLDESGLLLNEEMIFADVETGELYFAFYPGNKEVRAQYEGLADFFLGHTDHGQEQAVNLAYEFYRMSKTDYFVLTSFLPFVEKELLSSKQSGRMEPGSGQGTGCGYMDMGIAAESCLAGNDAAWTPEPEEGGIRDEKLFLREEASGRREEEASEEDVPHRVRKKGKFRRFFSFLRKEKKAKTVQEPLEEWSDMVWDSYEQQLYGTGSQETVYFADLDKKESTVQRPLCLKAEDGDRRILLRDFPMTFGKMKGRVTVVLEDRSVSRLHARIEAAEKGLYVRDLNSRNGTCINGRKLLPNEAQALQEGDRISFGREHFRCEKA